MTCYASLTLILCASSAADSTTSDIVQNVMSLRRLFVTKNERYMCIGPAVLRSGDKVFITTGCNFHIIQRESERLRKGHGKIRSCGGSLW